MFPYQNGSKLDFKTLKYNFVAYSEPSKSYLFYNNEKKINESIDVWKALNYKMILCKKKILYQKINNDYIDEELPYNYTVNENQMNKIIDVKRTREPYKQMDEYYMYNIEPESILVDMKTPKY